jgi:hypothetical protein
MRVMVMAVMEMRQHEERIDEPADLVNTFCP